MNIRLVSLFPCVFTGIFLANNQLETVFNQPYAFGTYVQYDLGKRYMNSKCEYRAYRSTPNNILTAVGTKYKRRDLEI